MEQWEKTGFKDKNGKEIRIGDYVKYNDEIFDVYENPFTKRVVIDNDYGQCWLSDAYNECEIV